MNTLKPHCNLSLVSDLAEIKHLHKVVISAFDAGQCLESVIYVNSIIEGKLENLESRYEELVEQDSNNLKKRIQHKGLAVVTTEIEQEMTA